MHARSLFVCFVVHLLVFRNQSSSLFSVKEANSDEIQMFKVNWPSSTFPLTRKPPVNLFSCSPGMPSPLVTSTGSTGKWIRRHTYWSTQKQINLMKDTETQTLKPTCAASGFASLSSTWTSESFNCWFDWLCDKLLSVTLTCNRHSLSECTIAYRAH